MKTKRACAAVALVLGLAAIPVAAQEPLVKDVTIHIEGPGNADGSYTVTVFRGGDVASLGKPNPDGSLKLDKLEMQLGGPVPVGTQITVVQVPGGILLVPEAHAEAFDDQYLSCKRPLSILGSFHWGAVDLDGITFRRGADVDNQATDCLGAQVAAAVAAAPRRHRFAAGPFFSRDRERGATNIGAQFDAMLKDLSPRVQLVASARAGRMGLDFGSRYTAAALIGARTPLGGNLFGRAQMGTFYDRFKAELVSGSSMGWAISGGVEYDVRNDASVGLDVDRQSSNGLTTRVVRFGLRLRW